MKILIHKKAQKLFKVISSDGAEVFLNSTTCTGAFWELARKFPDQLIAWCEEELYGKENFGSWHNIFHHNLIMASYAVNTTFLPDSIGYIDQMPFTKINRKVLFATWRMSSDIGGIRGEIAGQFYPGLKQEEKFDFILNSIAKLGQQNGLLCYSAPGLISPRENRFPESTANTKDLFQFVYQHYSSAWTSVLLLCFFIYEKRFPLWGYLRSFFHQKLFRRNIELPYQNVSTKKVDSSSHTIDVIIPTIGRPGFLHDVLKDLSIQSHLPEKVIIVEQNPDLEAESELKFIQTEKWPFQIVHHLVHKVGVCNARNIALEEVTADFTFFADDDIRVTKDLLKNALTEMAELGLDAVNMNCKQPREETVFPKMKQWGSFGAGTSVVRSKFAISCRFLSVFEGGYGEDADFGIQLRDEGCDIIYHPDLQILHLKAPGGGFREKDRPQWELKQPAPKPSPTLMAFSLLHFSEEQLRGYKTSLFIKFYPRQSIKNPFTYFKEMNKRWEASLQWAETLLVKSEVERETSSSA